MNERLQKYKESLAIVDQMEDELYNMVAFLFKNVTINSKFDGFKEEFSFVFTLLSIDVLLSLLLFPL